jgi:2,3-bisphosphoglycerate-dependent phosphoglycerate mutase
MSASNTGTRLYLMRHAHAVWTPDERRPLSPQGSQDAERVAERLAHLPIAAIYSSPSQRTIDTIMPLATRLRLEPMLIDDLRERDLPPVLPEQFVRVVRDTWHEPHAAPHGGEANADAQSRGLAIIRGIVTQHRGAEVVVSTHGTLLALVLHGLDRSFGFEFWQQLSFPDIYSVSFENDRMIHVERVWEPDAARRRDDRGPR